MRHRRKGRVLGRAPSHRKALLRNLASNLFWTERTDDHVDRFAGGFDPNPPKVKGRIVTTLQKAKEVRPLVEKCVTIARRSLNAEKQAEQFTTDAKRGSDSWNQWRSGDEWKKWVAAKAPAIAARRHVLKLIGDKKAVSVLFDEIAPRFSERDGGYTRIMRLAKPRLGDSGVRAILEFVGTHDRIIKRSEKPAFSDDDADTDTAEAEEKIDAEKTVDEEASAEEETSSEVAVDDGKEKG